MAIQQINLGSAPSGAGGDTQRAANTKINQNFSNSEHAASRLVGTATGNVMEVGALGFGGDHKSSHSVIANAATGLTREQLGVTRTVTYFDTAAAGFGTGISFPTFRNVVQQIVGSAYSHKLFHITLEDVTKQGTERGVTYSAIYTEGNTNKGTNGALTAKSPVTHLYHDRVEHTGNEKELQAIEFVKQGVGNYLLKNTTGLAQEGWYIVIPHDANGNPLIAVEYEDNDGDVNIRTYRRKFDYEQAKVVADHDNPMDIPETRWIDLRFNDNPSLYEEVADEPIE